MTNNGNIHISYMVRHDVLLVHPQHGGWILQAGKYKHLHLVLAGKLNIVISSLWELVVEYIIGTL